MNFVACFFYLFHSDFGFRTPQLLLMSLPLLLFGNLPCMLQPPLVELFELYTLKVLHLDEDMLLCLIVLKILEQYDLHP